MGEVGDQRFATAKERVVDFIAEQIADSDSRTHTAVSSRAGNPLQVVEESDGLPSTDIPSRVPSGNNGKHLHTSSSPSSACAALGQAPERQITGSLNGAVLDRKPQWLWFFSERFAFFFGVP